MHLPSAPRLRFRELQAVHADADFILRLTTSEPWLRFIGDRGVRTGQDALRYIESVPRSQYATHGFGLWGVTRLQDEASIGVCGLMCRSDLPGPDLAYALLPDYWGQGYAEEAARACLDHARDALGLDAVYAICTPDNAASIRLLLKLGFKADGEHAGSDGRPLRRLQKPLVNADIAARPASPR